MLEGITTKNVSFSAAGRHPDVVVKDTNPMVDQCANEVVSEKAIGRL
jgi:hypothetical protein